jgi:hypothetical protein
MKVATAPALGAAIGVGGLDVLEVVRRRRTELESARRRCEELVRTAPAGRRSLYEAMVREHTVGIEVLDDVLREAGCAS